MLYGDPPVPQSVASPRPAAYGSVAVAHAWQRSWRAIHWVIMTLEGEAGDETSIRPVLVTCRCDCPNGGGTTSTGSGNKSPILFGASLPLTGDFAFDGQAFQRSYELWQSDVNSHGGLLGRQVKLIILNDASSPTTVVSNYQKLISVDHVPLVLGPVSSLLTAP